LTNYEGVAMGHLIPTSAVYTFVVSKDGTVLGTFNNYQVKCQNYATGDCSITLNLGMATADMQDFNNYCGISGVYLLNYNDSKIYFTYNTMDSAAHNVTTIIKLLGDFGNTTLGTSILTAASGTLSVDIPIALANQSYYAETYMDRFYCGTTYFQMGDSPNWFGVKVFLELLIFTTLVMLFSFAPVLMVWGGVIGMITALLLFGLADGVWDYITIILFFAFAGIAITIKMRRGYG